MIAAIATWAVTGLVVAALATVPAYFADLGRRLREYDRTGVMPERRW